VINQLPDFHPPLTNVPEVCSSVNYLALMVTLLIGLRHDRHYSLDANTFNMRRPAGPPK